MSRPRFYCPDGLVPNHLLALPAALSHHAARVLRLADGDDVVLFDGTGGEFPATLRIEGRRVSAQLGNHVAREAELPGSLTLVQGIPSGDKMDWIIEKAVELGVQHIAPIAAERSVLRLSGERLEKRLLHWERVAQSAAEQCGRNRITTVAAPVSLAQWLKTPPVGVRLLCHPDGEYGLAHALSPETQAITLIVGPEGGWSVAELAQAALPDAATTRFKWGDRVLRSETAGVALSAAVATWMKWV